MINYRKYSNQEILDILQDCVDRCGDGIRFMQLLHNLDVGCPDQNYNEESVYTLKTIRTQYEKLFNT